MKEFTSIKQTAEHKPANFFAGSRLEESKPVYAAADLRSPIQRKASCACGGGCSSCQSKSSDLQVSQPGDAAEIEADSMADKVMRMEKPAAGPLQRKASESSSASAAPSSVKETISSSGRQLDKSIRSFMEPRFNFDFSNVRIHDNETAAISAGEVAARAYTYGNHIVFNSGQYDPGSDSGKSLLAHELAHVVQGNYAGGRIHRQQAPSSSRRPPSCPTVVATATYSRGNDDWLECSYETARMTVSLVLDPCACGSGTTMPLSVNYSATLEGKTYTGGNIPNPSGPGTVRQTEGQASHIASGQATPGRSRMQGNPPGATLSEDNLAPGVPPNVSGPLRLTRDDSNPGGRPGDPGDTLDQRLSISPIICAGGSTSGQIRLAGYQIINYSISADSSGAQSATITLTERPQDPPRIPTPSINLTTGGTPYPLFPGTPRTGGLGCTCNATDGRQRGRGCNRGAGGSGVGR